jgi:hypothetical protein
LPRFFHNPAQSPPRSESKQASHGRDAASYAAKRIFGMKQVSVLAEAIRNRGTLENAREHLASQSHVAQYYRAIALPALAAAAQQVASRRQNTSGALRGR